MNQIARLNSGIEINFQDEGSQQAPTIILIMGLGAQMTVWPDSLYYGLVEKGFRVIRFDNRDTGLSSHLPELGKPSIVASWLSRRIPIKYNAPYLLEDMAQDVIDLMAVLKIKKAHIVGASMGGMIGQILAVKHKKKVLSLTCIMSSPRAPAPSLNNIKIALKLAKRPQKNNREAAINYNIKLNKLIGSPDYPTDNAALRKQAVFHVDRSYQPDGVQRQLAAITASGCRRHELKRIKAKTLIIHGEEDPVISVKMGKETASEIKKHKLKIVKGMGHDFPQPLMAKLTKWISKHVNKAEKKRLVKKEKSQTSKHLSEL